MILTAAGIFTGIVCVLVIVELAAEVVANIADRWRSR